MNAPASQINQTVYKNISTSFDIPIVEAEISANDSSESLLQVLLDLQRHYQVRSFSHYERFGKVDEGSEAAVKQLATSIAQVKQTIEDVRESGVKTRLRSFISIELSS